ncbi:cytochrome-c peroxidase [Hyalangium sp.]|uniref:cytochrome-c peroxidase n=1 Tax=Hyalangium sp. TaxID=2028555 RepID=UPI002D4DD95E|nr:cytochrome c peroxidase [Hyalangium sp.]HYH98896.1 cytochrome c peroxidase [Hyalangium sp.]
MNANRLSARLAALLVVGLMAGACENEEPFPSFDELDELKLLHSMPQRPPADPTNRFADNTQAAALGNRLFHDPKLSSCGTVSCKSCHDGDGRTVATALADGCNGNVTGRNPPTILNADYNRWFMSDGRADRLWNQAILPMTSPVEMDSNATIIRAQLNAEYHSSYAEVFTKTPDETGDDELLANVGKLMQAYERTVNRRRSPFDEDVKRFISVAEVSVVEATKDPAYLGLKTYFRKGQCIVCHKGVAMTDHLFHNIGVKDGSAGAEGQTAAVEAMLDWKFNAAGPFSDAPNGTDAQRLASVRATLVEKRAEMVGAYKTPTLRNIALTAPYMHTGEVATLADVVEFYDKGGDENGSFTGTRTETIKKLELEPAEKEALVKLLELMTGEP